MALRFIDSFDHYSTADLLGTGNGQKWTGTVGPASSYSSISNIGRFNNGLRFGNSWNGFSSSAQIFKTLDSQATWVVGFAFKIAALPTSGTIFCFFQIKDSGSNQVELCINSAGQIGVLRNGTSPTGGTSTNTISVNTWYYIEYLVTISSSISANTWQVNVNSANWINVTAGQSSKNTANATANQIYLGIPQGYSGQANLVGPNIDYDDLYICDGTTGSNNTFLGDVRAECRFPAAASGTNTNWLASTGTTTGCISDLTPNGDNSYIYSATTNDISTFTVPALASTPTTIFGVQITHCSRKTDAGTRQITDAVRSGTTNYAGTTVNLSTSYAYYSSIYATDPNTSAAWTASAVNAVEIGVKEIT